MTITRRGLLGMLTALPFVPKVVEAATKTKAVAKMVQHNFDIHCESACPFEGCDMCDCEIEEVSQVTFGYNPFKDPL